MQNLANQLANLPATGTITSAGTRSTVAELKITANAIRQQYPQLCQRAIVLRYTNLAEFVTALIAFDGWCSAIYLCPLNVLTPQVDLIEWPVKSDKEIADLAVKPLSVNSADIPQTNWLLATSGTTGEPKWFSHSFLSLSASTKYSQKLHALCWGLLYQPFRFAGLQVVLQALLSGADLVDVTDCDPVSQVRLLQQGNVTAVSATPSVWRQLLMTGKLSDIRLSHITLGGEIVEQSVLDKLKRLFPQAILRHIYASTEAGVGFVVSDGRAGFPTKWLEDKSLTVGLKVSDKQHLLIKPSHQVCHTLASQTDAQGYVDTLDRVQMSDDRVLFLGRVTGTINVGGNKVHPEKVEQVLLQCADISQARVYAKKNAIMGALVVADIMIVDTAIEQDVKQYALKLCRNKLQRFEIPTKISIVKTIPHDSSGKLNRQLNRKLN